MTASPHSLEGRAVPLRARIAERLERTTATTAARPAGRVHNEERVRDASPFLSHPSDPDRVFAAP